MIILTPNGEIDIRPGKEYDLLVFRELRLEALRTNPEAFGADYDSNFSLPLEAWSERLPPKAASDLSQIFFAVHEGSLIGMSGIYRTNSPKTRHSATIFGVYVQPGWRGFHIAEGLVAACLDWAQDMRLYNVKLGVVTTNSAAIRCYSRCGFRVYGIEPNFIYHAGEYYDLLLMIKEFPSLS